MKLRDRLNKETSSLTGVKEYLVDEVMSFHWKSVRDAAYKYKSLEITNFATLSLRMKMIKKQIEKMERVIEGLNGKMAKETDEKKLDNLTKKLASVTELLEYYKSKTNEL